MSTLPDTALLISQSIDKTLPSLHTLHNQTYTLFSTHRSLNPEAPLPPDLAQALSSLSIASTALCDASRSLHRYASREALTNPHSL